MKLKVKNVLIVYGDDSEFHKGPDMGRMVDHDGCEVEVCKHGVEFVYADDFAAYIARGEQAAVFEVMKANEQLSEIIEAQAQEIDELHGELAGIEAFQANLVEDYDLDEELDLAEGELFDEWYGEAFDDSRGG